MTPQEINIAIAQECGWKVSDQWTWNGRPLYVKYGETFPRDEPPCYNRSTAACLDFESALNPADSRRYWYTLVAICKPTNEFWNATARQRCEAFLRVKGLWREDNTPQVTRKPAANEGAAKLTRQIRGVTGGTK